MTIRVGVDIGGTFTDGVLIDESTGMVRIEKVLTTPSDLSGAFCATVDKLAADHGVPVGAISAVMHASTVATNALLERKGATIGLLVTAGFRDLMEIGRQVRHELYNVFTTKPPSLVERKYSVEIRERLDRLGRPVVALELDDVEAAARYFRDEGVDAVAICFLHSYRNPEHEQLAAKAFRNVHPTALVSISSDIAPEIKEYWRASTSCVNAYVSPTVSRYLDNVSTRLAERGFAGRVGIMHSGGGIEGIESLRARPFQMIESGPAAGVAAAAYFARALGYQNALSFDMGGTTAKAGLILDGKCRVLSEFEVAGNGRSGAAVAKASGYPVLGEVVDLVEVGAGGGSIAWIDDGGHLRVGPHGAGASPGPACYGNGGTEPTITDANLVLGRLNARHFLGGAMQLSHELAVDAIRDDCAGPLGMDVDKAAGGIVEIAESTLIGALKLISIERGHDPREFCLIAFGGAGPVHACSIAFKLEIPTVLVLPHPGVASALGLLLSDIKHDVRATNIVRLSESSMPELRSGYDALRTRLQARIESEQTAGSSFEFTEYLETRYVGQSSRLRIELTSGSADTAGEIERAFHQAHEREFGYCVEGEAIEVVTLGITAIAPAHARWSSAGGGPSSGHDPVSKGRREVYFGELSARVSVDVYDRAELGVGQQIVGPAIIEEFDSTTVVGPDYRAEALPHGVLRLERAG